MLLPSSINWISMVKYSGQPTSTSIVAAMNDWKERLQPSQEPAYHHRRCGRCCAHSSARPPSDPRVRSTVKLIQTELLQDEFVCRYRNHDGLPDGKGAFMLCTFWLVETLDLGREIDAT